MPRAKDATARATRDQRVMTLYWRGASYREMGADPAVQLSPAGVLQVVRRQLAGVDHAAALAAFSAAYQRAVAGDEGGKVAQRRVMALVTADEAMSRP